MWFGTLWPIGFLNLCCGGWPIRLKKFNDVLTASGVGGSGLVRHDCEGDNCGQGRKGRAKLDHKVAKSTNFQDKKLHHTVLRKWKELCRRALALRSLSDPPEPNQPRYIASYSHKDFANYLNPASSIIPTQTLSSDRLLFHSACGSHAAVINTGLTAHRFLWFSWIDLPISFLSIFSPYLLS